MFEIVTRGFSWFCGQHADHTWICGGLPLPCCQRCAGLYLGALATFLLLILLRPPMTRLFLWLHGAMLMVMVPFGFHWLPQDALIRGWTGVLFGFGLVAFLRLPWGARPPTGVLAGASSASRATMLDEPSRLDPRTAKCSTRGASNCARGGRAPQGNRIVPLYWTGLAATLATIAVLHFDVSRVNGELVSLILACGAFVLSALAVANIWLGIRGLARSCWKATAQAAYE